MRAKKGDQEQPTHLNPFFFHRATLRYLIRMPHAPHPPKFLFHKTETRKGDRFYMKMDVVNKSPCDVYTLPMTLLLQ